MDTFDSGSDCNGFSLWFILEVLIELSISRRTFEVMSPKAFRETKLTLLFEARLLGFARLDPFEETEFLLIPRLLFSFITID